MLWQPAYHAEWRSRTEGLAQTSTRRPNVASLKKSGSVWFVQWYEGDKQRRRSLETGSLQIAKENVRRFESAV